MNCDWYLCEICKTNMKKITIFERNKIGGKTFGKVLFQCLICKRIDVYYGELK